MPISFSEPVYTPQEVAAELGLRLQTVRNHISTGLIKAVVLPNLQGSKLVTKTELERFKAERRPVGNPNLIAKRSLKEKSRSR